MPFPVGRNVPKPGEDGRHCGETVCARSLNDGPPVDSCTTKNYASPDRFVSNSVYRQTYTHTRSPPVESFPGVTGSQFQEAFLISN